MILCACSATYAPNAAFRGIVASQHLILVDSSDVGQLVQPMASFGGGAGAGESLNTAPLGADTSQQSFLTTPQHA